MSTPPDFFNPDNGDSRSEPQHTQERITPPASGEEERPRQPSHADTGPNHRITPQEHWPAPQHAPRWQGAPYPSAPGPQGPHHSGPIAANPAPPQAPAPTHGGNPSPGAPGTRRPEQPQPAAEPPNDSGTGLHHRPSQQGYTNTPAASQPSHPATPAPAAATRPVRRDDEDFGERTSIISTEEMAQARELGGFFHDPADTDSPLHSAPDSQTLFGTPMSGGPFVPAGYGGATQPAQLLTSTRRIEATGWRKALATMSFGLITPGPSATQLAADQLVRQIRASLVDVFVVAFVNSKGGVGKTTMAVAAGNAIARERGDRVIVVDVDTDLGNLSSRFHEHGGPKANIEEFAALPDAQRFSEVRVFTVQNDDRLEMLSSQNDPRSSYRLTSTDFTSTMKILRSHYNVVLLDCGTSITSPLFSTIANEVDCLVVVASQDAPGLNGAYQTQSWLAAHGLARLLPRTVVVLNRTGPQKPKVDMDNAAAQFRAGTEEVVLVPFDHHLDEGGPIVFDRMGKKARQAVMELAGAIARYYPSRQSQHTEGNGG